MNYLLLAEEHSSLYQKIGIEVMVNGEHMLLRENDRRFKFHSMNKNKTGFLSIGRKAQNNENFSVIDIPIWNDEKRRAIYKKQLRS